MVDAISDRESMIIASNLTSLSEIGFVNSALKYLRASLKSCTELISIIKGSLSAIESNPFSVQINRGLEIVDAKLVFPAPTSQTIAALR